MAASAQALVGLCFLKHGEDETHPQIKAAVDACKAVTANYPGQGPIGGIDVYSNGLAIVFLCEVNPSKYQKEINALLTSLLAKQKEFGGWGYPPDNQTFGRTGDTSMTQYGCLASWEAKKNGFVVPIESTEKVCLWLMRTQDPTGGWGYQGKDPGPPTTSDFLLVKQDAVRARLVGRRLGERVYLRRFAGPGSAQRGKRRRGGRAAPGAAPRGQRRAEEPQAAHQKH